MKDTKKDRKQDTGKKKMTSRQLVAIIGVALLILLYVITLIAAIVDSSQSSRWFRICLFGTFALPLVIWIYFWMYGRLTGKRAIGDPEMPEAAAEGMAAGDLKAADAASEGMAAGDPRAADAAAEGMAAGDLKAADAASDGMAAGDPKAADTAAADGITADAPSGKGQDSP